MIEKGQLKQLVVLVSGGGSNLQTIIDRIEDGTIMNAEISLVIADRPCFGLERAQNHNLPTQLIPRGENFDQKIVDAIPENTDLIVLAGFLSILNPALCNTFADKMINIHPALLPKYGGKGMWGPHVHRAVLAAGDKESGATVHYVTSGIDEGAIILQQHFNVSPDDTAEDLAKKVQLVEQEILPLAINKVLSAQNERT